MNIEDVIALSKAGFTSDQIIQMAQVPQQATAPQQPIQPMQQPMVQQPIAAQPMVQQPMAAQPMVQQPMVQQPMVQQPQVQQPQAKDPFQQLFEQMTGIKQAIQTNNIQNSQITGAAPQTTDDILASIIQPTKPKEE